MKNTTLSTTRNRAIASMMYSGRTLTGEPLPWTPADVALIALLSEVDRLSQYHNWSITPEGDLKADIISSLKPSILSDLLAYLKISVSDPLILGCTFTKNPVKIDAICTSYAERVWNSYPPSPEEMLQLGRQQSLFDVSAMMAQAMIHYTIIEALGSAEGPILDVDQFTVDIIDQSFTVTLIEELKDAGGEQEYTIRLNGSEALFRGTLYSISSFICDSALASFNNYVDGLILGQPYGNGQVFH